MVEIQCPVCLENIEGESIKTICGHNFHTNCLNLWKERNIEVKCPVCRADLPTILDDNIEKLFDCGINIVYNFGFYNSIKNYKLMNEIVYSISPLITKTCKIENTSYEKIKYTVVIFFKILFIFFIYKDWLYQLISLLIITYQLNSCKKIDTIPFVYNCMCFLPFFFNFFWNIFIYPSFNLIKLNIYNYEIVRLVLFYIEFYLFFFETQNFIQKCMNDKFLCKLVKRIIRN
jgi:hypothetical protein